MINPSLTIIFSEKEKSSQFSSKRKSLNFSKKGFINGPEIVDNNEKTVIIFGFPIIDNKINLKKICHLLINEMIDLKSINGQFLILIFDKKKDSLKIINDRFASIPIYWIQNNKLFLASFSYLELINLYKRYEKKININNLVLFEFLFLQKIQNNKTFDNISEFLLPASILQIENNKVKIKKYWLQNFRKENFKSTY